MGKLWRLGVCAGAVALTLAAGAVRAAPVPPASPTLPVTSVILVQPIDICDATGCASPTYLPAYEQTANAVWNQANIGFDFLPSEQVTPTDQDYLTTTITIAPGFPSGTPTDQAHQLMYGPGHGQNPDQTVLNAFFVDNLNINCQASSCPVAVYGQGFIGGNGVVLPTLPNPVTGLVPALDTLAHELGHNLGLAHVDNTPSASPYNLMQSIGRITPTDPCQITPYTCSQPGTATDNLTASQISKASNPLFTIALAKVTATESLGSACVPGVATCGISINFAPSSTTQSLLAFKIRFLDPASVLGGPVITGFSEQGFTGTGPITYGFPTGGAAVEFDFASGVFTEGDSFNVDFCYVGGSCGGMASDPFSAEFDFSSGVTSTGLFDASGVADSQFPISLGFIGTPSNPTMVPCAGSPCTNETDIEIHGIPPTVPEPPAMAMLLTALGVLGATRRRSRQRARA